MHMKRNIKSWIVLSCCFLLLIISIVTFIQSRNIQTNQSRSITLTNVGFDTPVTFQADCSKQDFTKYTKILRKIYTENNKRFDPYHPYKNINNIYTLNHEAARHPVTVDNTTLDCIRLAIRMNRSCQKFDVSYGNTMNIWQTYRDQGILLNSRGKDGKLPDPNEIRDSLSQSGIDKIRIRGNDISYTDNDVQLDLGGIAKGYTTQLAKTALNTAGLHNGFINAGGNVVLLGSKPDGSPWSIGIQNPDTNTALISLNVTSKQTIVTSGDYQRYYTVKGKSYGHIIDIDTGYPAHYCRSVSVIAKDSGEADAYSTALFCLRYEEGVKLAKKEKIQAIWIFDKKDHPKKQPLMKTDKYYIYATKQIKDKIRLAE